MNNNLRGHKVLLEDLDKIHLLKLFGGSLVARNLDRNSNRNHNIMMICIKNLRISFLWAVKKESNKRVVKVAVVIVKQILPVVELQKERILM
jgi:hypothetical protein